MSVEEEYAQRKKEICEDRVRYHNCLRRIHELYPDPENKIYLSYIEPNNFCFFIQNTDEYITMVVDYVIINKKDYLRYHGDFSEWEPEEEPVALAIGCYGTSLVWKHIGPITLNKI